MPSRKLLIHEIKLCNPEVFDFEDNYMQATHDLFDILGKITVDFVKDNPKSLHLVVIKVPFEKAE